MASAEARRAAIKRAAHMVRADRTGFLRRATHADRVKVLTVTIKDCKVQTFRAGGPGGANQNKRDTGVRVIHPPSGARGESRECRTQLENKRKAFRRMGESKEFRRWVDIQHGHFTAAVEAAVDEQMRPENLLIEYFDPDET